MTLRGEVRLRSVEPIRALLDRRHVELADDLRMRAQAIESRSEALDDDTARREARALLTLMAGERLYEPIRTGDIRALCVTREIVGAASPLADAVLALQALGGTPIAQAGSEAQRSKWLDAICSGRAMAAFAMTEPGAGSDVAAIGTSARRDGSGWIIDGDKHLISNAGIADMYVVFATTTAGAGHRGLSAFVVPADTPGLTFAGPQVLAAPHPIGRIRFESCRVPADALLGPIDGGFKVGMMALDALRPTVGAAACGMAARALVETLAHATSRQQFGAPLASFQITREKIGRLATELEAARLLVYRAAGRRDTQHGRITLEAAMAKSFATEAAQRIIDEAVQIAGGVGVLVGHPVERLYRAVRALRIYEGTTEIQRLIIADQLLESVDD